MRIIHTADWHLGRSLRGQPFHPEQEWLLTGAFLEVLRDTRPDLVVIAGDIYDRTVPPRDSIGLLGDVLHQVIRGLGIPVVMIAGNHDDPQRLAFAAPLLREAGLFIADSAIGRGFAFADDHGPVHILAADYGSPALIATLIGPEARLADHDAAFEGVMQNMRAQAPTGERSIVVGHAFVQGGLECDSERLLQVGGSGSVSARHLSDFGYVALGHLHRPQDIEEGRIRYAGSPLAYSFSEAGQEKSVTLVELDAAGVAAVQILPLPERATLRVLRGSLAEVLASADGPGAANWLQVVLTDRPFDAMARLRERYPAVLDLSYEQPRTPGTARGAPALSRIAHAPLDTLAAFWEAVQGETLPDDLRQPAVDAITLAVAEDA